ncbi:hypothetical protein ACS0TY_020172 [Phlomoides rotata]
MADENNEKEVIENLVSEVEALPKAIVRRVVKEKLSQISADYDISVLRDSLQAFSESARTFIHYLSATANDICKESNRQILNAEDVFKALEEIEFVEFIEPLRDSLEEFRQRNARRKSAKSTPSKNAGKKSTPSKDAGKKSTPSKDAGKKSTPSKDAGKKPAASSKAKHTNIKAKRKEPPSTPSESRKKQRVVESDGDKGGSE